MRILILTILLLSALLANEKPSDVVSNDNKNYTEEEEELRLMLQSFLYLNNPQDAYKVAIIGYKKYPDSIFWNQQIIDTSKWSGHYKETVKYEIALYKKTHDPKLRDDIINYSLSDNQYKQIEELTIQKAIENPNDANIKMMIYIQNKLGTPEKAARILEEEYQKDKTKTELLTKELQLYLDIGDLESAKKVLHVLEKLKLYEIKNIMQFARFYLAVKDYKKASDLYMQLYNRSKENNDKKQYFIEALKSLQAGNYMKEAVELGYKYESLFFNDIAIRMFLLKIYIAAGDLKKANELSKKILINETK